jgi:hypothetical protein
MNSKNVEDNFKCPDSFPFRWKKMALMLREALQSEKLRREPRPAELAFVTKRKRTHSTNVESINGEGVPNRSLQLQILPPFLGPSPQSKFPTHSPPNSSLLTKSSLSVIDNPWPKCQVEGNLCVRCMDMSCARIVDWLPLKNGYGTVLFVHRQDKAVRRGFDSRQMQEDSVRLEVFTTMTMKNAVFWDIKTQFVLHRRHITSPLQSPAS